MEKLFGRMNGDLPEGSQGTKRKAGDAVAEGGFSANFNNIGEDDTTLCPAPEDWSPTGSGNGASGTGYIEFDTHCDNGESATAALTDEGYSGDITISKVAWDSDYKLTFSYSIGTCEQVLRNHDRRRSLHQGKRGRPGTRRRQGRATRRRQGMGFHELTEPCGCKGPAAPRVRQVARSRHAGGTARGGEGESRFGARSTRTDGTGGTSVHEPFASQA